MDNEANNKLLKILKNPPDENCCLDYKVIPYDKSKKASFIKDICGFLNSSEAYEKDKFIIFGIRDSVKERIGLNTVPMYDDEEYQGWCDFIEPRPIIETGKIKYDGIEYGYVYITKDNKDRVYSVNKDYPGEHVSREDEYRNIKNKVYASVAYTRKGSRNYILNEYDRREIYEHDRQVKENVNVLLYSDSSIDDDTRDILKMCALFGVWDENNENEKNIITDTIGIEYNKWIKNIRKLLREKSKYISFDNNRWKIENKEELIEKLSDDYFEEDIKKFEIATLKIITEADPKFELEADKRIISNLIDKGAKYSKELIKSVLESFAYIKSINNKFVNCEHEINNSQWYIVRNALQNANWKNLATLNEYLPILSEIDEVEYMKQLDTMIKNREVEISNLFKESGECITAKWYASGLLWGLELISWNPNYIMQAFDIFAKLGKYDDRVIDSMSRILLPWYPQTNADFNLRKSALEMILTEYNDIGWKLLMQLMPNQKMNSYPTYKPKWNNIIVEEDIKVTNDEIYKQYYDYVKLAISYSKTNKDRIINLINEIDKMPKDIFDLICDKLKSDEVKNICDEEKYYIWNEIENVIARNKLYIENGMSLPEEAIEELENVSKEIKPQKECIYYKRLFNNDCFELFDSSDTYEIQEKKILKYQKEAINKLLKLGIDNVINFAKITEDPYRVGIVLAELKIKNSDEKIILSRLNEDDSLMPQGYVYKKYSNEGFDWLDKISMDNISTIGKARLFEQLPKNKFVWDKIKTVLGNQEDAYWKNVNIHYVEDDSEYDYPLVKLLNCGRSVKALELICRAIHDKKSFSKEIAAMALNNAVNDQGKIRNIDVYFIMIVIKHLQDNNYDVLELFKIEWEYLSIIYINDEYRPITIEKVLSENPKLFVELICIAFRNNKNETNIEDFNTTLSYNAYRLLNAWKFVPGTNEEGYIDGKKLNLWFEEMKKLSIEKNQLDVSLLYFGKVLFYAGNDKDGSWIDKNVVELLNRDDAEIIRKGYLTQAINSVGAISAENEENVLLNLENKWNKRVDNTDVKYFRFVKMLRDIACDFHEKIKYIKK